MYCKRADMRGHVSVGRDETCTVMLTSSDQGDGSQMRNIPKPKSNSAS